MPKPTHSVDYRSPKDQAFMAKRYKDLRKDHGMRNIAAQRQEFIASKSSPPSNFASAMLKKALPKLIDRKQGKSSFPADVKPPANVSKPYTDPAWEDEVDAGAILTMTSVAPLAVLNAALVKQRGTDSGAPSDAPLGFSPVSTLTPRYADGYKGVQQDVQESVAWNKHHAKEFFSLLRFVGERILREGYIQRHIKQLRKKQEEDLAAKKEAAASAAAEREGSPPPSPVPCIPPGWDRQIKFVLLDLNGNLLHDNVGDDQNNDQDDASKRSSDDSLDYYYDDDDDDDDDSYTYTSLSAVRQKAHGGGMKKRPRLSSELMGIKILASHKSDGQPTTPSTQIKAGSKLWCATMRAPRAVITKKFLERFPQKHTVVVGIQQRAANPQDHKKEDIISSTNEGNNDDDNDNDVSDAVEGRLVEFDLVAVASTDLHSLGNVCRRVQNESIARARLVDTRLAVLDGQMAAMLSQRGGSFKMTTVRTDFEEQFGSALVPSLFGVRWVKDLMNMLPFSVQVKPLHDDMLIMTATDESVWVALRKRMHVAGQIQRTQHLTASPVARMEQLESLCRRTVEPLLRQISDAYASLLKFDVEFCQILHVLDRFQKLQQFFDAVRGEWTGEILSRPPHAWLDGIARGILKAMLEVQDCTSLKPKPKASSSSSSSSSSPPPSSPQNKKNQDCAVSESGDALDEEARCRAGEENEAKLAAAKKQEARERELGPQNDFWEDIDRIQDRQAAGPIGGFHGRFGFSAKLWCPGLSEINDMRSKLVQYDSASKTSSASHTEHSQNSSEEEAEKEEEEKVEITSSDWSLFSTTSWMSSGKKAAEAIDLEPTSPLSSTPTTAKATPVSVENAPEKSMPEEETAPIEISPCGVDMPLPSSIHRRGPPGLSLMSEFDLESDEASQDDDKENASSEPNKEPIGAEQTTLEVKHPISESKSSNILPIIYDGLQLTQDAKEKLKAADIQDEMNLAEFREHDLEEIGLKVASRVKVRAWIKHANRGNKKRTALGLLSSSSS